MGKFYVVIALSILLFSIFPWQETDVFARHIKVQNGKNTLLIKTIQKKCLFRRKLNTFLSVSLLKGRVLLIFRRKTYGPNPSEMNILVIVFEPTQSVLVYTEDQSFPIIRER